MCVPPALVLFPAGNRLSFSSFGGLPHEHSLMTAGSVQLNVAEPTLSYTLKFSLAFLFRGIMKMLALTLYNEIFNFRVFHELVCIRENKN